MIDEDIVEKVRAVTLNLVRYCQEHEWEGYDPYDALNSKLIGYLPLLDFKIFRLGFTQLLKRIPINVRPLLLIPKIQESTAIAAFLMALLKLDKLGLLENKDLISVMIQKLIELRSPSDSTNPRDSGNVKNPYWCWGLGFPWQTRGVLVPQGAPNLVCTAFAANALLDAYQQQGDTKCLRMAVGAAEYVLSELYWTDEAGNACFAYPTPLSRTRVHNANFLGAALLCRVSSLSGERGYLAPALKVARYSGVQQQPDGSWFYGEHPSQRWIDNFHTGYNLCALKMISDCCETKEFDTHIRLGFDFYRRKFFRADGAPRYFDNRTYPIDIHCVAQSIIALSTLKSLSEGNVNLALSVFRWSLAHLRDRSGFFYYQAHPMYTTKIAYMRWSEASMLLALSTLLGHFSRCDGRG